MVDWVPVCGNPERDTKLLGRSLDRGLKNGFGASRAGLGLASVHRKPDQRDRL
jgi:hypothetical protein